jgi:serine/threonine protein kinase
VHAQGVLHMDAHLENILTDGERLYLCDFGLAIAMDFELGADERRFAGEHQDFDRRVATTGLLHAVVSHYAPSDDWRQPLRELDRWDASMPAPLRAFVRDRAEVALEMGVFYRRLLDDVAAGSPSESARSRS